MGNEEGLAQWMEEVLKKEHLSGRGMAIRTKVSHATIAKIRKGERPHPKTILKLVKAFGRGGQQRLTLEDRLMTLAGHRTPRPKVELSETMAGLMDKLKKLSVPQVKLMGRFADYIVEIS